MLRVSQNRCRGNAKSSISLRRIRQIFNRACNQLTHLTHNNRKPDLVNGRASSATFALQRILRLAMPRHETKQKIVLVNLIVDNYGHERYRTPPPIP